MCSDETERCRILGLRGQTAPALPNAKLLTAEFFLEVVNPDNAVSGPHLCARAGAALARAWCQAEACGVSLDAVCIYVI